MRRYRSAALVAALLLAGVAGPAAGQVVLDNTLHPHPSPLTGPDFTIPASVGATRGKNLFHSFSSFSLTSTETATFTGPSSIENVIARVTGGRPSSIDGAVSSTMPSADFWFINPAGVVFGPSGSINVGGSIHVSTADELHFSDGAVFSASHPTSSGLTAASPAAFGFLGANGSISITGNQVSSLQVTPGKTLSLSAQGITLDGIPIDASGGEIDLVSTSGPATVPTGSPPIGQVPPASLRGPVSIANGTVLGSSLGLHQFKLVGGRIVIDHSVVQVDASDAPGLASEIDADSLSVTGGSFITSNDADLALRAAGTVSFDQSTISTISFTDQGFGRISIAAGSLQMTGGSALETSPSNPGALGGSVSLDVTGPLSFAGNSSIITSNFTGIGAGDVTISAGSIALAGGSSIATNSLFGGPSGSIKLTAGTISLSSVALVSSTAAAGTAGDISILAQSMNITGGSAIEAAVQSGLSGANIVIAAGKSVLVSGEGPPGSGVGPSHISSSSIEAGAAGAIHIDTPQLELSDGGQLLSTTSGSDPGGDIAIMGGGVVLRGSSSEGIGSTISTSSAAGGAAGSITMDVGSLALADGAQISAGTAGTGHGGSVSISAHDIRIDGTAPDGTSSAIATMSTGTAAGLGAAPGDAGSVEISADTLRLLGGGTISTEADEASGGNIALHVDNLLYLKDSTISTSVRGGAGNGGNIAIDPEVLVLDNSMISANAVAGHGGNINIVADNLIKSPDSTITATSQLGLSGAIAISSPETDIVQRLLTLPATFIDPAQQLAASCTARSGAAGSSLVEGGRGGLPAAPGGMLLGSYLDGLGAPRAAEPLGAAPLAAAPDGQQFLIGCGGIFPLP
jgi:filamentous hemagglutinin family protein